MKTIDLDTNSLAPCDRIEGWRQSVNETFGPIHVEALKDAVPRGVFFSRKRGALAFHSMRYRGMSLWRKPLDVAQLPEEFLTLTLPGSMLDVVHFGQKRVLQDGHIYLFNHAVTYKTDAHREYRTHSIAFAAGLLRQRVGTLQPFYDLSTGASSAAMDMLRSFAEHLTTGAEIWTDHEYVTLVDQLLDMVGLFLQNPSALSGSSESCARKGHMERAIQYIRVNAGDSELTPVTLAHACGISLSYLHGIFRRADMPVEETIFKARLELARRLLIDPRRRGFPISSVCYEAGFSDPGHFTRKFKATFGVTPRELREATFKHV